jgi:hypothetical protein
MNITDEMSGAEKQKTLNEWLDEAEKLYGKCKPLIDSCTPDYDVLDARQGRVITEDDDARTIISKVNAMLDLEKKINDAMKICQANECVENALKLGSTNRTRKLETDIRALFEKATGAEFQFLRTTIIADKATLAASLAIRYDAIARSDAGSYRGKTAGLMDRLAKQLEKFPDRRKGYWISLKEMINYEKRFSDDSHALYRDNVRGVRQKLQDMVLESLQTRLEERVEDINEAANCLSAPHDSTDSGSVKHLSDEDIANNGELLDDAIESVRDIIAYAELLSDSQTPQIDPDGELRKTIDEEHEGHLNLLTALQSTRAFWESAKLVKRIDSLKISEDIKKNVSRLYEATRELTWRIAGCYPHILSDEGQAPPPGDERNKMLLFLAKSYEHLAGECHWLAESFPKRQAETFSKLGENLSGAAEGLFKELDLNQLRSVASESECKAFIDDLLGASREDAEERNVDDKAKDEEEYVGEQSMDVRAPSPSEAKQATASAPSLASEMEGKKVAALIQEVNRTREEKARQIKAINEDKRNLEKIEQKLDERMQEIERIKRSLSQGAHIQYLAWDLENAPTKAARLAQLAQRRTLGILDKLKTLEEISISAGAVSDERHRDDMAEYAEKAAEYEKL